MSVASRGSSYRSTLSQVGNAIAHAAAQQAGRAARSGVESMISRGIKRARSAMSTSTPNPRTRASWKTPRLKKRKRTQLRKKGQKKVKVSKKLRAKIQKVCMDSDEVPAKYTKKYTGWIALSGNNLQDVPTDLQQSGTPLAGSTFTYFNPTKILDAASILFNSKTAAMDWTVTTNNLDNKKAVIYVDYMSVKLTMKNFGLMNVTLKIYECVAKKNNISAQYAWNTWSDNLLNDAGTVNLSSVQYSAPGISPTDASGFSSYWTTKVRRITLKPGQEKSIKINGPKGKFNFPDYFDNVLFQDVQKGITTNLLVVVDRKLGLWDDGITGANQTTGLAGQATGNGAVVGVYVTEKFVIRAPEISNDAQKFKKFAYFSSFASGTNLVNTCQPVFGRKAINNDVV